MNRLTVGDIVARKSESLQLEVLTGEDGFGRAVTVPEASSPGLVLAGFTGRFLSQRLHVLGETEIVYLRSIDAAARQLALTQFLGCDVPAVFVTKGLDVPEELLAIARDYGVPLLRSRLKTAEFYRRLAPYLAEMFAPRTTLHGSLADVYGVGLMFVGQSGIGKSECVLDLVERGHRLVADDAVQVTRRGADVLIGKASDVNQRYMEIRGVGIVDVPALFGVRAVRHQKRIEVVVQLTAWDSTAEVDRTGLDPQTTHILDVELPKVNVPLNPGKNITVVAEVVAMNHLARYSGIDAAKEFNDRLIARMSEQRRVREYLAEDYE